MLQAEEDGRGAVAFGTVLDHFAESGELASLVDTLPHICRDPIALEASQERFTGGQYQCARVLSGSPLLRGQSSYRE